LPKVAHLPNSHRAERPKGPDCGMAGAVGVRWRGFGRPPLEGIYQWQRCLSPKPTGSSSSRHQRLRTSVGKGSLSAGVGGISTRLCRCFGSKKNTRTAGLASRALFSAGQIGPDRRRLAPYDHNAYAAGSCSTVVLLELAAPTTAMRGAGSSGTNAMTFASRNEFARADGWVVRDAHDVTAQLGIEKGDEAEKM